MLVYQAHFRLLSLLSLVYLTSIVDMVGLFFWKKMRFINELIHNFENYFCLTFSKCFRITCIPVYVCI